MAELGPNAIEQLRQVVRASRGESQNASISRRNKFRAVSGQLYLGKLSSTLSATTAGTTGATVDVWVGTPGSEAVTTMEVVAYDWMLHSGGSIAIDKKVIVGFVNGQWYVISAEC